MNTHRISAVVAIAIALTSRVGLAAIGGPDSAGYTWADQNEPGVDNSTPRLTGPLAPIDVTVDAMSSVLSLDFDFPFYGQSVRQFRVSPHGWLTFDPAVIAAPTPPPLPNPNAYPDLGAPSLMIAPLWMPLTPNLSPVRYQFAPVEGGAMFRFSARTISNNDQVQWYIVLYQSGAIKFWYDNLPARAAIEIGAGIQGDPMAVGQWLQPWLTGSGENGFTLDDNDVLLFSPPPLLDCSGAQPLICGVPAMSSTPPSVPINVESYLCSPTTYSGLERVFTLELTTITNLTLELSNWMPAGIDLDIILLQQGTCNELRCIDYGDTRIDAPFLSPGNYMVVVDGDEASDVGLFTLTATCEARGETTSCNSLQSGVTAGASVWNSYPGCSSPTTLTGPEYVYELSFAGGSNITAALSNHPAGDVDILAFRGDELEPGLCFAYGNEDLVLFDPPAGDYVFLVDGKAGFAGAYDLEIDCGINLDCGAPLGALQCGVATAGANLLAVNNVERYSCAPTRFTAPEVAYTYNHAGGSVSFLLQGAPDLTLMLVPASCNEAYCVGAGSPLDVSALPAGDYYVIVDGVNGARDDFTITPICENRLQPSSAELTLRPGTCASEHKTAFLLPDLANSAVDVLFAFDVSIQQEPFLPVLNSIANNLIDGLIALGIDVRFGLAKFSDYPEFFSSCAYNAEYGVAGDFPYLLQLPLGTNRSGLASAIDNLTVTDGGDGPDSYARVLAESVRDGGIGWRANATRVVLMTGDDVPHDCSVGMCRTIPANPRGVDPGRDEIIGTMDDLDILSVMGELAGACTIPIHLQTEFSPFMSHGDLPVATIGLLWNCWTGIAEGKSWVATTGNNSTTVAAVNEHLRAAMANCRNLTLRGSTGFESWVQNVTPPSRVNVRSPALTTFDLDICAPPAAPTGLHSFDVELVCDCLTLATQQVEVSVTPCDLMPDVQDVSPRACPGDLRSLDGSGSSIGFCTASVEYQWRNGDAVVVSPWATTNSRLDVTVTQDETYTLEVRCSNQTECPGVGTLRFPVVVDPPADAGDDALTCVGGPIQLGNPALCNPAFQYSWSPTDRGIDDPFSCTPTVTPPSVPFPLPWDRYTLTVTNPTSGCMNTDDVFVVVEGVGATGLVGNGLLASRAGGDVELDWALEALPTPEYNVHATAVKAQLDRMSYGSPLLAVVSGSNTYTDVGAVPEVPRGDRLYYDVWGRNCDGSSELP